MGSKEISLNSYRSLGIFAETLQSLPENYDLDMFLAKILVIIVIRCNTL